MYALRKPRATRQIQHVTHAQQRFRAHLVQNGSGVNFATHLKRNTRRYVGLNQACDDIHTRPLGGQNQVNTCRARFLG